MALSGTKFNANLRIAGKLFSEESSWQESVLDIQEDGTLDPGASPATGARYIINDSGSLNANFGTITGVGNGDIVEYDGSDFVIVWDASANTGAQVYDEDSGEFYLHGGTSWGLASNPLGGDSINLTSGQYDIDLEAGGGLESTNSGNAAGQLGIADGGVTTDRLAADAVTNAKLADDAVETANILDANVTDAKLATGIDAAKLSGGSVSNTEFDYLDGVTSAIQTQLNAKQNTSEKGQANGYASLDANSKIPSAQLPAIAITDVFSVADITARDALTIGTGDGEVQEGDVAIVTDASADPSITSGAASYIYNGSSWSLLKAGDEVLSVNGQTGTVTVNAINELTGDVTTATATGSESEVATISAGAVDTGKLADDAVTADKIGTDAVTADGLNYTSTKLRSGALTDPFTAGLTRTFTHNWSTTDVAVEVFDSVTGETCFVDSIVRAANTVAITLNQTPTNSLRVLLRELDGSQTTITVA